MTDFINNKIACPFCLIKVDDIIADSQHALAIYDSYPISRGHTLIIPRRHVGSFFRITQEERDSILGSVEQAKLKLDKEFRPNGYNIGINDGSAAGQTVPHLHIHLIPRYKGDQTDPRGGVRWIFPEKADYWSQSQ